MSDLIDRQAAIDAVCEHGTELERRGITVLAVANHKQVTIDLLESLPSVHPDIIRCKDCESWQTDWALNDAPGIHFCAVVDGFHDGDWYCADAERRTDE